MRIAKKYLIFIVALVLFTTFPSYATDWKYTFTLYVTGPYEPGTIPSTVTAHCTFHLWEFASEFGADKIKKDKITDIANCPGCTPIGDPSRLVNCAGYVLGKLFSTGSCNADAGEVLNFAKEFGHKLNSNDPLKEDDIVIYGNEESTEHVAIVTSDDGWGWQLGLNRAIIEGKDNQGTPFSYTPSQDDTFRSQGGGVLYYRIDQDTLATLRQSKILSTPTLTANPGPITCPPDESYECYEDIKPNPNPIQDLNIKKPAPDYTWVNEPYLNVVYDDNKVGSGKKGDPQTITRTYRATFSNDPNPSDSDYSSCTQTITLECTKGECIDGVCTDTSANGGGLMWDTPFDTGPQYLLHIIGGNWFLYHTLPTNGKLDLPDGSGGTYTVGIDQQLGGLLNTPREVCQAGGQEINGITLDAWNSNTAYFDCKDCCGEVPA